MYHIVIEGVPYCACTLKPDYADWDTMCENGLQCEYDDEYEALSVANLLCVKYRYHKVEVVEGPCPVRNMED